MEEQTELDKKNEQLNKDMNRLNLVSVVNGSGFSNQFMSWQKLFNGDSTTRTEFNTLPHDQLFTHIQHLWNSFTEVTKKLEDNSKEIFELQQRESQRLLDYASDQAVSAFEGAEEEFRLATPRSRFIVDRQSPSYKQEAEVILNQKPSLVRAKENLATTEHKLNRELDKIEKAEASARYHRIRADIFTRICDELEKKQAKKDEAKQIDAI
eukprot:TRINITY_DN3381_c0_g1_i2.p1 TRINITY_DN3381_c0_g1~~TRINITY_DN3381_c0_g1_i2.p1  ORF type:complete len:210 (+),score=37.43 TRINITY_DN3381_c0_g1_i2:89-718(+)